MNRNTSYRPQTAKTTSVKKTTTKSSSLIAQTADLDSTGKKIVTKTQSIPTVPKAPTSKKTTKNSQASLSTMSAEEAEAFIGDYRSDIITKVVNSKYYNSVFNNEDEEDNNAILLSNFTGFLKMLNSTRKSGARLFAIWLKEGLYIFVIKSIKFEQNYYFFPSNTVPQYRFNGKPRYYYFTIQDLTDLVNSIDNINERSFFIITEKLVDDSEGNYLESPKGSGKEVLEFIVFTPSTQTSAKQSRDISFDPETAGYIPDAFLENGTSTAVEHGLPEELEALKSARKRYDSWDIVSNVANHNDIIVKKMMRDEMRTCQIVYDKEKNNVDFSIENKDGSVSFVVGNEKPPLDGLDDPITFKLVYVTNNVFKGLSKNNISQRMYMNTTLPGFIKIEVSTIEHTVGTILTAENLESSTVVTASSAVNEKKVIRTKKTVDEESFGKANASDTVPVPKSKPRGKKTAPVNDIY